MWRNFCLAVFVSFILSVVLGKLTIPLLKKLKAGQVILGYVSEHKTKAGTPTCGGLFFIAAALITYFIFNGFSPKIAAVSAVFTLGYGLVGFIDDFIKIRLKRNLGLKAYQKIIFQVALAVIAAAFCFTNGLTSLNIPFSGIQAQIGKWIFLFVPIVFIATSNCVNLTDGLDGLAGSSCAVFFLLFAIILQLQTALVSDEYLFTAEYTSVSSLSLCLFGALLGFLVFNMNKASVFMGDTGSMALGGAVASITIFTSDALFIPILGIMFVVSGLSVIIQVISFKSTGKRVFLMAPFHHHLQEKGFTECKIAYMYALITFLGGLSIITYYLW